MRFRVTHETVYGYERPVAFSPHLLRLTPRADSARVSSQVIEVDPLPLTRREVTDRHGNSVIELTFAGEWSRLAIISRFEAETGAGLLETGGGAGTLPELPWGPIGHELSEYRDQHEVDASVVGFARERLAAHGPRAVDLLDGLTRDLYERTDRRIRWSGAAQPPGLTLATRSGACRDLTVLFMAVCRSLGVAARFVSGYQAKQQTPDGQRHLHGWPEVHLPGVGWCGWDPMYGVRAGEGHLALAAGASQADTMPVEGGFCGTPGRSTLEASVRIATE